MGSGTTATASKLSALGIEIGHEASDTRVKRARDGTVSWAHGLRYLDLSADRRASTLARLCKGPRNGCWMPAFYDGGPLGHGFGCASAGAHVPVWDECWRDLCLRVASREIGCALRQTSDCTSPFRRIVLQVRHPLRTIESNVFAFCGGEDHLRAAVSSIQLDTLETLIPAPLRPGHNTTHHAPRVETPAAPPHSRRSRAISRGSRAASGAESGQPIEQPGECSRRFGWWWVNYIKLTRPHVHSTYRVEDISACVTSNRPSNWQVVRCPRSPPSLSLRPDCACRCQILVLAGVLPPATSQLSSAGSAAGAAGRSALPESDVPHHLAASARRWCESIAPHNESGKVKRHGDVNHKNGAKGHGVEITYEQIRAIDPALHYEMSTIAAELGYDGEQ
jgi:hypothetical protein